jgi:hypothetical protein
VHVDAEAGRSVHVDAEAGRSVHVDAEAGRSVHVDAEAGRAQMNACLGKQFVIETGSATRSGTVFPSTPVAVPTPSNVQRIVTKEKSG